MKPSEHKYCIFNWYILADRATTNEAIKPRLIERAKTCYDRKTTWYKRANRIGPDHVVMYMKHWISQEEKYVKEGK